MDLTLRQAARSTSATLKVLQTPVKDLVPAVLDDLLSERAQRRSALVDNATAVRKHVNERLKVWLEQGKEELLHALQHGGDVRERQEGGEDNL